MTLKSLIKLHHGSLLAFSQRCSVPYATIHDLCSGKMAMKDCTYKTLEKIAIGLNRNVDELFLDMSFQTFRDNLHVQLKNQGELEFLLQNLINNNVRKLWNNNKVLRALYLLSMIDYLSNRNNIPICAEYDDLRKHAFEEPVFMGDSVLEHDPEKQRYLLDSCIPEFKTHNIIEGSVYDTV